jgi:hypothetical protein
MKNLNEIAKSQVFQDSIEAIGVFVVKVIGKYVFRRVGEVP